MPSTKTRNPQDATLRNIRALKARVAKLEATVRDLVTIWMPGLGKRHQDALQRLKGR